MKLREVGKKNSAQFGQSDEIVHPQKTICQGFEEKSSEAVTLSLVRHEL